MVIIIALSCFLYALKGNFKKMKELRRNVLQSRLLIITFSFGSMFHKIFTEKKLLSGSYRPNL